MSLSHSMRSMRKTMPSTASTLPTNDFHQVRLSEYRRDHALKEQAATPEQVPVSYFVPTLQSICADLLAKGFNTMQEVDTLKTEQPKLFDMVVSRVQTEEEAVPLAVSVPRIEDEKYWKRACEARWSLGQISKYADERLIGKETGWKQLFLERALCDYLLSLRSGHGQNRGGPSELRSLRGAAVQMLEDDEVNVDLGITEEEATQLAQLCHICKDYIHRIDLPCQYSHIKLYEHLFSKLPNVYELRLSYGTSNAGVGFHRRMIGFTDDDARAITNLLRRYRTLQSLRLPSNRLTTLHVKSVCSALVGNSTLKVLDLSHNALKDDAIQVVAIIISQQEFPIEELYLGNNNVRCEGALALANAMEMNKTLRILHLQQNRIPDEEGGPELFRSLVGHPCLTELHMGSNCLGPECAATMFEVLPQLTTLTSLNLSGNRHLGGKPEASDSNNSTSVGDGTDVSRTLQNLAPNEEVGRVLVAAVEGNTSIRQIDVRNCLLQAEDVAKIESIVYERVRQQYKADIAEKESMMREEIRVLVDDKISRTKCPHNPLV